MHGRLVLTCALAALVCPAMSLAQAPQPERDGVAPVRRGGRGGS